MDLQPNESEVGSWTVNFLPPDGGRYTGKLLVTDQRVLFDAKFDTSAIGTTIAGTLGLAMADTTAGSTFGVVMTDAGDFRVSVPRSEITGASQTGSFLSKKVEVTTRTGPTLEFHYGVLPVKNIVAAIAG